MFSCPFCNRELTEKRLRSGRCPYCQGDVKRDAPAGDAARSTDRSAPGSPPRLSDTAVPPADFYEEEDTDSASRLAPMATLPMLGKTTRADDRDAASAEGGPSAADGNAAFRSETMQGSALNQLRSADAFSATFVRASDTNRAEQTMLNVDIARLDEIWRGTYQPSSRPNMTIKGGGITADSSGPSVIKRRVVRAQGKHSAGGQAEAPDYELLEIIGEGGVGVVYAARQTSVNRTVAVKMLRPFAARDVDSREKFLVEATVTGELDHPNIVPIYDLGTDETGAMFYSMKRVEGTPWSAVIRQKSIAENLEILMKAADALAFAHARNVVHRDLKPENVMLGNFGEVLVMDWGIALSTSAYLKQGTLTQSNSMGGTPAYMAPEMATGPLSRIGPRSDVYLLGALLFEIVTGLTPHTGHDVLSCLHAAARNEIQPTDKSGELLDIAYRAMATEIEDRYESVHAFQQAVRAYQSHSESIALAARAEGDLEEAQQSRDYELYARALFAYQEALALWPENSRAAQGLQAARLTYARVAYENGDYDLGLSVLDESDPAHHSLRRKLLAAQQDRRLRQLRMRNLRRTATAVTAAVIVVLTVGVVYIQNQKRNLNLLNDELQSQQVQLMNQKAQLESQQERLQASNAALDYERARLERSNVQLEEQKAALFQTNQQLALEKRRADAEARAAREQEQRAEQASYVAQIGLAAAQIDENAFLDALRTIAAFQDPRRASWRHWEWGRLKYVCERASDTVALAARVECADATPDGKWFVTGLANGQLHLWKEANHQPWATWQRGSAPEAIAIAPEGTQLAVSHQDSGGAIELLAFDSEQPDRALSQIRELAGHSAGVVRLRFSRDGRYLLSTSLDQTAILWDVSTGEMVQVFRGHFGPVWDAVLSADNQQVYTAGEDRTVGIWDVATGQRVKRFRGHHGPVYAVAVTSDQDPKQRWVVSAGEDRVLLAWQPELVNQFDYERLQRKLINAGRRVRQDTDEEDEQPIRVMLGHTADVRSLRISPDNQYIASGSNDNTVRVWALASAEADSDPYRTLRGHGGWVRFAAFSSDGTSIVSAGYDQQVKWWRVDDYAEYLTLDDHEDAVLDATYSPDGTRVMTVGRDEKAIVWDARTGDLLQVLEEGHDFLASSVAFFPPGVPRVATSAGDGTTIIWRLDTSAQLQKLTGTGQNSALAIAPGGKWMFTGSDANDLLVWPLLDGGTAGEPQRLAGHLAPVSTVTVAEDPVNGGLVAFSGDGAGRGQLWRLPADATAWIVDKRIDYDIGRPISAARFLPDLSGLLTASADQTLRRWRLSDGREETEQRRRFEGPLRLLELVPGGEACVVGYTDRENRSVLELWDLAEGKQRQQITLASHVFSIAPEPDGNTIVLATDDAENAIWRWDVTRNEVTRFWGTHSLPTTAWSAQFLPGGDRLVTVGGNAARIWDVATGHRQLSLAPHGPVLSCDFAPHGRHAATAGQEGSIKIWDLAEGRVLVKLPPRHLVNGRTRPVHAVVYAPYLPAARRSAGPGDAETDLLVSAGADGTARLWWLAGEKYREGAVLTVDGTAMLGAAFSPDGTKIVTASADGIPRIWDVMTGELLREFTNANGHRLAVNHAAFSRDGALLVTASDDNTAILWEVDSGKMLRRFTGHTAGVTAVGFSPDARRLITASQDGTAKLWDTSSGDEILTLKGHSAGLSTVAFSPDGRMVLSGALDGRAIIWPSTDVPPSLVVRRDPLEYSEPGTFEPIDDAAGFIDPDDVDFEGAELIVELTGMAAGGLEEQLRLRTAPGSADTLEIADGVVRGRPFGQKSEMVEMARYEQMSPRRLRVVFTAAARHRQIAEVVRHIEYSAHWQELPESETTIELNFTGRDGTSSTPALRQIRFRAQEVRLAEEQTAARTSGREREG